MSRNGAAKHENPLSCRVPISYPEARGHRSRSRRIRSICSSDPCRGVSGSRSSRISPPRTKPVLQRVPPKSIAITSMLLCVGCPRRYTSPIRHHHPHRAGVAGGAHAAHRIAGADEAAHRPGLTGIGGVIARGGDMDHQLGRESRADDQQRQHRFTGIGFRLGWTPSPSSSTRQNHRGGAGGAALVRNVIARGPTPFPRGIDGDARAL